MRTILTIFASVGLLLASAQITITQADMPSAGDTMRYTTSAAQNIDVATTGAGMIWDMSHLVPQVEGADTAVTVGSTPILYQFYFNNQFIYPDHQADYAQKGPSFSLTGLQVTDVFEYYKVSAVGFRNVGFGANINGIPASVRRDPIDRIFELPMNFGDVNSSPSSFEFTVPTVLYFSEDQQRDNIVDGWGTLYLPTDTFEVLRVKTTLLKHDSVFVEQIGTGFGFDLPETIEYKWIAAGMDIPVLLVTSIGGTPTTVRFYYDPEFEPNAVGIYNSVTPKVFPNPTIQLLTIELPATQRGFAQVLDATGKVVRSGIKLTGNTKLVLDVSDLSLGNYFVRNNDPEQPWTVQFVVAR